MSTHEEFLQMITENPDDLHTRLVYADWLREDGRTTAEQERGEFIWKSVTGVADWQELSSHFDKKRLYEISGITLSNCEILEPVKNSIDGLYHNVSVEGLVINKMPNDFGWIGHTVFYIIRNGFLEQIKSFSERVSASFLDCVSEDIVLRSPLRAIEYVVDGTSHTIAIHPREVGWRKRAKFVIAATLENGQSTSVGGLYFRRTQ